MILQALYAYYSRLREDGEPGVALPGFAPQKISYALVIDREGQLVQVQDIRDTSGKKPRPVQLMVPEAVIKASGVASNFMWDNTGYVLGLDDKGKPERTRQTFEAFKILHHGIGDSVADPGMRAILRFLDSWKPRKRPSAFDWDEITGSNLVFRLNKERGFIHEHPAILAAWMKHKENATNATYGMCLVTGERTAIARLHAKIKGVRDAQTVGAAIVSFNLDAFRSYGKEQNYNAPIGEEAAFAYTTALNHLLRFESRQKLQIGDATTVFWTDRSSFVEDFMGNILDPREESAVDAADKIKIENYLKAVRAGKKPDVMEDDSMRFYILGLAPNASRLAVRFWYSDTVEAVNKHIGRHFADLAIVREYDNQAEFPGMWQLLVETSRRYRKGKRPIDGDMNSLLSGAFTRSIIQGLPYPSALLASLISRIRADGEVNYYRAALIKAVLRRNHENKEVNMSLNEESPNVAYRLGRLFAVLEKAQEEAIPGANATIKDRFFGSASATPSVVFPQLIRLSQHHLAKLEGGAKIYKEQLMQTILGGIDANKGFPAHLRLEEQGMFTLGYYHQRKAFFTKKEAK
ncbi:MAG: type I-C CRISPR-associated protein Cas8c/Csd1 [Spirochaetes bacterium]|nr:type I-C CRISPR-associated protein Cas8c/Csd1 [Spirochaetota bacterium]